MFDSYEFLAQNAPYGGILPVGKNTEKLNTAVKAAMSCLVTASDYDVHNLNQLKNAPDYVKIALQQTFTGLGGKQEVCTNIIQEIGSLNNLTNVVTTNSNLEDYVMDTHDIYSLSF